MPQPEFLVSDGISQGRAWATYRRRLSGSLQRVKSPALPLRPTREEAERDLARWLIKKGCRCGNCGAAPGCDKAAARVPVVAIARGCLEWWRRP